jgi:hypothetical protein
MPRIDFDKLPDDSRIWVFPVQSRLSEDEREAISRSVTSFLDGWAAHGTPLTGAFRWEEGRFLVVGVDQASVPPSGCSIDSMVRVLKGLEQELQKGLVDHSRVYFRDPDGGIAQGTRAEFRAAAAEGRVSPETRVFDTTLTSLAQLRGGRLEVPASQSWHGSVFF